MGLFRKELLLVGLVLSLSIPQAASPDSFARINALVIRDAPVHAEPSSDSDVIAVLKPGMIIHMNPLNSYEKSETIPSDDPPGYWHRMGCFIEGCKYGRGYSAFDHEDDYDIVGYIHSNDVSEYFFSTKDYGSGKHGYAFIAMETYIEGNFTNNLYYMDLDLAELPRGVVNVETLDIRNKPYLNYSKVLGVAKRGEVLTVLYPSECSNGLDGKSGLWLRVLTADGVEGWAFGPYIDVGDDLDRFIYEEAFSEPVEIESDEEAFALKGRFEDFLGNKAIKVDNTGKYPIAVYEYVDAPYNGWTTFCEYVFFALGGGGGSFLELYHWKVNYYDPGSSIEFGNYNVSGDGYIEYKYASFDDVGLHDTTTRSGYIDDHAISVGEGRIRVPESGTYDSGLLPEPSEITYESAEVLFETVVEAGLYSELVFNEDGNPDDTYLIKTLDPGAEVTVDGYLGWRLYLHCTGSIDGWISASDVVLAGGEPGFIRMSE